MSKDAKSLFRIPKVKDDVLKIVCVVLNIVISGNVAISFLCIGSGTIVGGFLDGTDVMVILCGVLQLICGGFALGYIWSWVWAYFIAVQKQVC